MIRQRWRRFPTDNLRTLVPTIHDSAQGRSPHPTRAPLALIPTSAVNVDFAAYDDHRVIPYANFTLSVQHELARA
jgi:hypothetical protein